MNFNTQSAPAAACSVTDLVPFVHVADVEASLHFYSLLGFATQRSMQDGAGRTFWARARSGVGEIMFARADGPVDSAQQAVLFYMYSDDVVALRKHLLACGVHDGAAFHGQPGPNGGRCVVFEVMRPHYMPAGELRVSDPDAYCILIGQLT